MLNQYLQSTDQMIYILIILIALLALTSISALLLFVKVKKQTKQLDRIHTDVQEAKFQTERSNHRKSTFIASAAHDLRQPLQALTLFCNALDEQNLDPASRQISVKIHHSLDALVQLFNTLFDVSNLETGSKQVNIKDFSLKPLLGQLSDEYENFMRAKGLKWTCEQNDITVHSDPVLLETIIRNLISNALRYTVKGGVSVISELRNENVFITIRDSGIGIAKHLQKDIFREYYQLEQRDNATVTGHGLGLSIVDRLIKLLGHEIRIDSEQGKGTEFTLVVNAGKTASSDLPNSESVTVSDTLGLTVLIIDDDPVIRDSMQTLLSGWQCTVHCADNAAKVFELVKQEAGKIDVIVSDFRISKYTTGLDIIEILKSQHNLNVPVLFVTGDTSSTSLEMIRRANFQVLPKPVQPAQLRSFLRAVARTLKHERPENSKQTIETSAIDLVPTIKNIIKETEAKSLQRGIRIQCEYHDITVHSQIDILQTIIRRIIKFALKNTAANKISIQCYPVERGYILTVNDYASRLTDPSVLAIKELSHSSNESARHSTTNQKLDLGMSIVCELANKLQHKIEIDYDPTMGNRYSIIFPSHS